MAGRYIFPSGNFLDLSGGTVTGLTNFTNGISGSTLSGGTIYSGDTDISNIFLTTASTLTAATIYETNLFSGTTSPGINVPVGTTVEDIRGQTFSNFIDNYVFPTTDASISSNKSGQLIATPTLNTVEVGTSLNETLTASFNQGQIQNGNGSAGPSLVGLPNTYTFTGPGIATSVVISSMSSPININTSNPGYEISKAVFGSNIWSVNIIHSIGTGVYFDSKGNIASNLDGNRVAGNVSDNSNTITGRYYAFYNTGILPTNSNEVRVGSSKSFLSGSNAGSFNISISANEPLAFFAVPAGKSATVLYVESSNADVTGSFSVTTFNVDDAGGNPVSYDIYTTTIGGGGYPSNATYNVTIV